LPAGANALAPKLLFALAYCLFAVWLLKRGTAAPSPAAAPTAGPLLLAWLISPLAWVEIAYFGHFDVLAAIACVAAGAAVGRGRRGRRRRRVARRRGPGRRFPPEVDPGRDPPLPRPGGPRPRPPPTGPRPPAGRRRGARGARLPGERPGLGSRRAAAVPLRLQ